MKKDNGFTLMELLAVIVVITLIAVITTPIIMGVINKSKKGADSVSIENIIHATQLYVAQHPKDQLGKYVTVEQLVEDNLLKAVPKASSDGHMLNGVVEINDQLNYRYIDTKEMSDTYGSVVRINPDKKVKSITLEGNTLPRMNENNLIQPSVISFLRSDIEVDYKKGNEVMVKTTLPKGTYGGFYLLAAKQLTNGQKYHWSIEIKSDRPVIAVIGKEDGGLNRSAKITTEYQTITMEFTSNASDSQPDSFVVYYTAEEDNKPVTFTYRNLQVLSIDEEFKKGQTTVGINHELQSVGDSQQLQIRNDHGVVKIPLTDSLKSVSDTQFDTLTIGNEQINILRKIKKEDLTTNHSWSLKSTDYYNYVIFQTPLTESPINTNQTNNVLGSCFYETNFSVLPIKLFFHIGILGFTGEDYNHSLGLIVPRNLFSTMDGSNLEKWVRENNCYTYYAKATNTNEKITYQAIIDDTTEYIFVDDPVAANIRILYE